MLLVYYCILITHGLEIVISLRWMELVSLLKDFKKPFLRYCWPLFLMIGYMVE